jgi:hypothetical protein
MPGKLYIIGAGASRSDTQDLPLPTPLVNDFLRSDYLEEYWSVYSGIGLPLFRDSALSKVLSHYFPFHIGREENRLNIEEVRLPPPTGQHFAEIKVVCESLSQRS